MRHRTSLLCLFLAFTLTVVCISGCDGGDPDNVLTAPTLLSPEDEAVLDNGCSDRSNSKEWAFDWSDVNNAEAYHIFVTKEGAQTASVNRSNHRVSEHSESSLSFIVDRNRFDWLWRVRAQVDGTWSPWSEERSFDVKPLDTDC